MLTLKAKLIVAAVASVALLGSGFSAGWAVNGWRKDSEIKDSLEGRIDALNTTITELDTKRGLQLARIEAVNSNEATEIEKAINRARGLVYALREIQDQIASVDAGACNFTDDADRLRAEAYRRATERSSGPAPAEAGGAHGRGSAAAAAEAAGGTE